MISGKAIYAHAIGTREVHFSVLGALRLRRGVGCLLVDTSISSHSLAFALLVFHLRTG